jgi:hypothetical protein
MRRLQIAFVVMLIVGAGCAKSSPPTTNSNLHSRGAASALVAAKIRRKDKFEEVSIQGGTGVLVDGHWAFWVKDGKIFALNGLAKSIAPDLEYGPPGLGSEELREALNPAQPSAASVPPTAHENPLGNDVHEVLRKKGYLAHGGDVNQSVNVWKHRSSSATITGRFEGRGNGMFNRKILNLELQRDETEVWKADRIRVEQGILYIDTGSGWLPADIEG